MRDLFHNSTRLEEPHYHTAVTSGDELIWDFRTTDPVSAAGVVAVIYNITRPEQTLEMIYSNTINTMAYMETTGEYVVTTAFDTLEGIHATIVRCYQECITSPSMN